VRGVEKYLAVGYRCYERIYKVRYQHREYSVVCPEFRNDKAGFEPVVVILEFLIPRRPFPVEVYLYAIDLYRTRHGDGSFVMKSARNTK